jgi:phage shock protein C
MPQGHFRRHKTDKILGGVAGGFARYFGIDVKLMRILTFVACLTGVGLLAYILIWLLVDAE